jgi:hypothetical protein
LQKQYTFSKQRLTTIGALPPATALDEDRARKESVDLGVQAVRPMAMVSTAVKRS